MASGGTGHHSNRISPRKFSEKIALLNKKEREANKKFEEIIKEVQETKQNQHPQQACSQQQQQADGSKSVGLAMLQDELRLIDSGEGYRAVHADSLEEIEKVYENLMKSVGQYDDNEGQENNINQRSHLQNRGTQLKSDYNVSNLSSSSVKQCTDTSTTNPLATNSPFIPPMTTTTTTTTTGPFYEQRNANLMNATQTDLGRGGGGQQRATIKDSVVIPCETVSQETSVASFCPSGGQLDICNSVNCKSQQQVPLMSGHSEYTPDSAQFKPISHNHRARVVSFGSATRHKYPCATSNLLNQQGARNPNHHHHQPHRTENLNYHTQYLKEPSGDRSRQKSCSDPQLHISPNQLVIVDSNTHCSRSENRLADNQNQALRTMVYDGNETTQQAMMDCYYATGTDPTRSQGPREATYNLSYAINYPGAKQMIANDRIVAKTNEMPAEGETNFAVGGPMDFCQNQSLGQQQEHLYSMCDTTSTLGQLPGIKICTIEDEMMGQRASNVPESQSRNSNSNTSTPPSRDGSLPDISNLKFGTNSTSASPERDVIGMQKRPCWPAEDVSTSISGTNASETVNLQQTTNTNLNNEYFHSVAETNWSAYDDLSLTNVEMEVQVENQPQTIQDQYVQSQQQQQQTLNQMSSAVGGVQHDSSRCWSEQNAQQPFGHTVPKVNNLLSNSDCGFNTSSTHQQHGSLMICTSSDFYNNIIRSRSHNNISSINNPKRGQHVPYDTLPQQMEQHHMSQFCLQTDQLQQQQHQRQPVVNVRRIAELKASETSTSPLDSSSDLNSPQSEINSPASSTTEQCESSVLFLNTTTNAQQDCRFASPVNSLTNGSNSTLVADGLRFISTESNHQQDQQHCAPPPPSTSSFCQSTLNQSHQQALACRGEAQHIVECSRQTCQPMPTDCSRSLHNATTYSSPKIAPTIKHANTNIIMDEHVNQSQR